MQRTRDRLCWLFALVMGMATSSLLAEETTRERSPYHAYAVGAGHADYYGGGTSADLVVPLWSNDTNLFFTDLRSRWNSSDRTDLSAGLAYRHLTDTDQIFGGYGFYDYQNSHHGIDYHQGMFGLEMMSLGWEARANAYLSSRTAHQVGPAYAAIAENRLFVYAPLEAAYAGTDFEMGALLADWKGGAIELRGFAGGFYGGRDVVGFESFVGPRVRTELRLYGLPWLGHGARLVAEGVYQWDDVRGSQRMASLAVRVPLNFGERRHPTRIERRMLDRIVRSPGILTDTQYTHDPAVTSNGDRIAAVTVIDANTPDPVAVVAGLGEHSLVGINGSSGAIELTQPLVMNNYQTLAGSGSILSVKGSETGLRASYRIPGDDARLVGTNWSEDVIVLPEKRGVVVGLDIRDGRNGIVGEGASDFTLLGNHISRAHSNYYSEGGHGIYLRHSQGVNFIARNWLESNDWSGLYMFHPADTNDPVFVNIDANSVTKNGQTGLFVGGDVIGHVTGNYVADNRAQGLVMGNFAGQIVENEFVDNGSSALVVWGNITGEISDNSFRRNGGDGILVNGNLVGDIVGNESNRNDGNGIRISGDVKGDIVDNDLSRNAENGLFIEHDVRGDLIDNTLSRNGGSGVQIGSDVYGNLIGNSSTRSERDGFELGGIVVGSLIRNTANMNDRYGINGLEGVRGDIIANETNENDWTGLKITMFVEGSVVNNEANLNGGNGIEVYQINGDILSNRADHNGLGHSALGGEGLRLGGWVRGEIAENEVRNNSREGILLILRPNESVFLRENLLVGNYGTQHELWVRRWGEVNGRSLVVLKDNISRNDLSGSSNFDYRMSTEDNIEFYDAGGNIGKIEPNSLFTLDRNGPDPPFIVAGPYSR